MDKVKIKTKRIQPGWYKYDGEHSGEPYTIKKKEGARGWVGWYVLVGYGDQKEPISDYTGNYTRYWKTKKEAVEHVVERETLAKGLKEAREMGLELEKKIGNRKGSMNVGGFIGGKNWTMLSRLRIDGEPITDWLDGMAHDSSKEDSRFTLAREARESGYDKVSGWHVKALTDAAFREYNEDRDRNTTPPWSAAGGSGISRGAERHWVLK